MSKTLRPAFTLVELLTVIAIIAILAAILIPTIGNVINNARKTTAANNLRQIAVAYMAYSTEGGKGRAMNAESIYDWARILAEKVSLNDPALYILKDDPLVEQAGEKNHPKVVATPGVAGAPWSVDSKFQGFPLSFAVANKLSTRAPVSTTPIAWTRGLKLNGLWSDLTEANPGVYGAEGGHVAFLDGHVTFYENLTDNDGQLLHFVTKKPTANIREALSPNAEGLDYKGKLW